MPLLRKAKKEGAIVVDIVGEISSHVHWMDTSLDLWFYRRSSNQDEIKRK